MSAPRYSRSADATESTVGDRVVLYHRISRTALVLNPTGTWIWQQLASPRHAGELATSLRTRFQSIDKAQADRDVAAFLDDLSRHSMVSVV
jgi:hypothetical protein